LFAAVIDNYGPFYIPIPSSYVNSNNKAIDMFFSIDDVYNSVVFVYKVTKAISGGSTYTVFVKVRYNHDDFFMAGNQFAFTYSTDANIEGEVRKSIMERLDDYLEGYGITRSQVVYL